MPPDSTEEKWERFNEQFNEEFLARNAHKPWPEYPWNEAVHVRLNSLKTGTIVVTTPTETKYRTLPFQLTLQLRDNLDFNLISVVWDFLEDNPDQFYLQPTWIVTVELFGLQDFYEAWFDTLLGNFSLDQNNNPNNDIGLLGWIRDTPNSIVVHFKLPDVNTAIDIFNEILGTIERAINIYVELLVYSFIKPLQETGQASRLIFDEVFDRYQHNRQNFKVFVDELIKHIPTLKPFLNRRQFIILEDKVLKQSRAPPLVQRIMNVIEGKDPPPR